MLKYRQILAQVSLLDIIACARSCRRFASAVRSSNTLYISLRRFAAHAGPRWQLLAAARRWDSTLQLEYANRFENSWRKTYAHHYATERCLKSAVYVRRLASLHSSRYSPQKETITVFPVPLRSPTATVCSANYLAYADRGVISVLNIANGAHYTMKGSTENICIGMAIPR